MNPQQRSKYLQAIGVQQWALRHRVPVQSAESRLELAACETVADVTVLQATEVMVNHDWSGLQQQVAGCTLCPLHQSRTQTVFGVGNPNADCLIIGEAPGVDEDAQGEPFVGRAGQLLNLMLKAIGLQRDNVYIANILKCRPPSNRDPQPEEAQQCSQYLKKQIEWIQPKVILAVGRISAQNLLQTDAAIGRLRGSLHRLSGYDLTRDIDMLVTYHPAYLLRKPIEKRKAWDDLKQLKRLLQKEA